MGELIQLLSVEQDHQAPIAAQASVGNAPNPAFAMELQLLSQRLENVESRFPGPAAASPELKLIEAQLKLLEARLPSDTFTIGGRTFNSKADVALFVEKDMPGVLFSLFHDAITLLESISDRNSQKADVMASMYQASRIGFDEDEATHAHSFKLIIPSIMGATKDEDKNDPKYPLPAVKDFVAWNPQHNAGGIKKHIQDGVDDVFLAVTESILSACDNLPAAAKLATEMLYQTQVFLIELCSWVDSFYLELIKTSQVPAGEAWILVASCLQKFFEVLHKFRASADRAASKMDNATRTTANL